MRSHHVYKAQSLFARKIEHTEKAGFKYDKRGNQFSLLITFALYRHRPQRDQKWYWGRREYMYWRKYGHGLPYLQKKDGKILERWAKR